MAMNEYRMETHPICKKEAMICGDGYRISILTPSLLRLEYNKDNQFEDRATQMIINREFPVADFKLIESDDELVIHTSALELHYNRGEFSTHGLSIKVGSHEWHYGEDVTDLGGTARTLDMTVGSKIINVPVFFGGKPLADEWAGNLQLEPGVVSWNGFSVLDDSHSMVLENDGWISQRETDGVDIYFFGYGHRYQDSLRDFYHLCGKTPLLPRYALGNWWSRYYPYSENDYKELVNRFEDEQIPFSVAVLDMDWHLVNDVDPKYGSGWTGYTWNKKLFPDPKRFMDWLHCHNMKVTLNVHPADGIRAYEDLYPRVAEKMDIDPSSQIPVQFDAADPKFMEVYFKELHHPLEEEGVDFWWIDWQQGTVTKVPGLDPLWILNHYHYLDSKWKGTRPITFSRYAGIGSHRYPIGFSGDSVISWETLDFQPYFTSTAGNIGYGWWSHDIGGHMLGYRDDSLMARWIQFGVFSPINRLHSSSDAFNGKEPWKYDRDTEYIMKKYLQLRHAMIPYLYTMNRRASRDCLPLMLPMYYREPDCFQAYTVPNEYYFGTELIVSPITKPQDSVVRKGKVKTWIPEGLWADFFTGTVYHGGKMLDLWRDLEDIPVLMKAGAILPLKDMRKYDNKLENPERLEVYIFPAADGTFTLWEDAGDTPEDLDQNWASTKMDIHVQKTSRFVIHRAEGNLGVIPSKRSWRIIFSAMEYAKPTLTLAGNICEFTETYDHDLNRLIIEIPEVDVTKDICVDFEDGLRIASNNINKKAFSILEKAQMSYELKSEIYRLVDIRGKEAAGLLAQMELNPAVLGALCEILSA